MEWPSKNVPHGGILHPAKANYRPDTKEFLKVLMDESKMSMFQRGKMNYYLRTGEPLPLIKPKKERSSDSELTPTKNPPKVLIRPGSSKRRTKETIVNSGAYDRERFIPKSPPVDREKEKNRFQNKMAYGKNTEPKLKKNKPKNNKVPPQEEMNRFDQLVKEINERQQWLRQMEKLGEGPKYKFIIQQQINAKIREMEKLKKS